MAIEWVSSLSRSPWLFCHCNGLPQLAPLCSCYAIIAHVVCACQACLSMPFKPIQNLSPAPQIWQFLAAFCRDLRCDCSCLRSIGSSNLTNNTTTVSSYLAHHVAWCLEIKSQAFGTVSSKHAYQAASAFDATCHLETDTAAGLALTTLSTSSSDHRHLMSAVSTLAAVPLLECRLDCSKR